MSERGSGDFSIGSDVWPGLSKVVEECGELLQVIGKLMGTGGAVEHWDGSNLQERLEEEIADVQAALMFVINHCPVDRFKITQRSIGKSFTFDEWHAEQRARICAYKDSERDE